LQGLSGWCLRNRRHAYKISRCWSKVVKRVKSAEQKLTLFYLLNDVVQHAKRKNYAELLAKFEPCIRESLPAMKKEEKIAKKIRRVLDIWSEREVFAEKFVREMISELEGVSATNAGKDGDQTGEVDNFQPGQLCTQLKIMKALQDDAEFREKALKEHKLDLDTVDVEGLRTSLKDRQHGREFQEDFEEGRKRLEAYIKALEKEVNKRGTVVELLTQGGKYYNGLLEEATIVANAYSNFEKRVKVLKGKLVNERFPQLSLLRTATDGASPDPR